MKKIFIVTSLAMVSPFVFAGAPQGGLMQREQPVGNDAFASARRPISNPTLFDSALPATQLHPMFIQHRLPQSVSTELGDVPLGGDVQLYGLQFEVALNERFSIVAMKDGYVDMNPGSTLSHANGFANLGGGVKYAWLLDPISKTAVSGTAMLELPTGNSDVLQGEGEGMLNLVTNGLRLIDDWQFSGSAGLLVPLGNEQSFNSFVSTHVSYEVCPGFIPLIELNWFHVLDSGNGSGNYQEQLNGDLPKVLQFEGGDLFNLGSKESSKNRDLLTMAVGFRSRWTESVTVGAAYEMPLMNDQKTLMKDRVTLDMIYQF
jgi:hypothetical protein